jgi:hypothetical protein
MHNKILHQSRRRFLEFVGKSGISSYALKTSSLLAGLMANRYAQANANKPVKRVIFVYTPLGTPYGLWLPQGNVLNEATQAFEGLQPVCHFHETEVVNAGFGQMWKALGEVRYINDWTSNTIDHQIAAVLGTATPFPTLHLGVQTLFDSFSRKNLQAVRHLDDPLQTYEALFGAAGGPAHFQRNTLKSNILDAHLQALDCSRTQLSSAERVAIEQYENSLNTLKNNLENITVNSQACTRPPWNSQGIRLTQDGQAVRPPFAEQAYLQAETLCHALTCGLTNVATLQLGDDQGSFVPHDTRFQGDMHQSCHTGSRRDYAEVVNYLSRCIAYLIKRLAEQDDPAVPGTTLLDNTLVVQVSSQGDGDFHTGETGPVLIATRMPEFKTGLATPFRTTSADTHLRALQTVAAGLGLEQFIGKQSHHCIWPCGETWGGVDTAFLT